MAVTNLDEALEAKLQDLLDKLAQGDVVHIEPLVILGAPATSLDQETVAAAELTDEPIVPVARTSSLGLYGIITQTCDVARMLEDEPFLHVCPLVEVSSDDWEAAREGRYSVRRFSYPSGIDGHECLVLEVRVMQTIEKTALLDGSVKPLDAGMTDALRRTFAEWLGKRFARHAFPDDLEKHVLDELRSQIRDKLNANSPMGGLLRSVEGVWIKHNESKMVSVLFVLNTGRAMSDSQLQGDKDKINGASEQLLKALRKKQEKSGSGYQIDVEVKTPKNVSAYDLFYDYHPLDVRL